MSEHLRSEGSASDELHEPYAEAKRRLWASIYADTSKYHVYENEFASLSVSFQ